MPHSIDNVCSFSIDPETNSVLMQWHGYATTGQFRAIYESLLALMLENNISKVLADTRDMKMISMEDQKWLEENWLPRALTIYRACGLVVSKEYFTRVTIDNVIKKIDPDALTIEYFDNVEKARDWLKYYDRAVNEREIA